MKRGKGKRKGQLIAIATFVLSDFGNNKQHNNTQIMKLGIVISSNDAETVWNALRLGNLSLTKGDEVKCFLLLAKGVEAEGLSSEKFDVQAQMEKFVEAGGQILACGTCLKIRNSEGTELCPLSRPWKTCTDSLMNRTSCSAFRSCRSLSQKLTSARVIRFKLAGTDFA